MGGESPEKIISESIYATLGQKGTDNINDTSSHYGQWCAIKAMEDTVINTIVENGATGNINGVSIDKGDMIHGLFTEIRLTSGRVRAHRI